MWLPFFGLYLVPPRRRDERLLIEYKVYGMEGVQGEERTFFKSSLLPLRLGFDEILELR